MQIIFIVILFIIILISIYLAIGISNIEGLDTITQPLIVDSTATNITQSIPSTTSNTTISYPTTSYPTDSIIPTTSYPTTSYPTDSIISTTPSPTTSYPTASYPTTSYPTDSIIPTTPNPTTSSPTTSYPTTPSPTTSYPTTSYPRTSYPTTPNPTTFASTLTTPATSDSTSTTSAPKIPQLITGLLYICNNSSIKENTNANICNEVSYKDNATNTFFKVKGILDPYYYIDSTGFLKQVPSDNISKPDNKSYIPKTNTSINNKINYYKAIISKENIKDQTILNVYQNQISELTKEINKNYNANTVSNSKYDSNNFNLTYHAINPVNQTDENSAGVGKMWVKDKSGKLISVPYSDVKNTTTYYQAGSYPYGPSSYVPNYEESVYLSKLTHESSASQIKDSSIQKAGFCKNTASDLEKDKKCNSLDKSVCASTECCVLLGGEKCVAGNTLGPTNKKSYSDFLINNRDFYYYQGKCYGNCT